MESCMVLFSELLLVVVVLVVQTTLDSFVNRFIVASLLLNFVAKCPC